MTNVYRGVDLDPYLNIAKIESFSKYCFAICDIRFLDIAFKDVIKDVTDSESKYFDFSKTLHRSPPISCIFRVLMSLACVICPNLIY